jgi:hypothetical protein
MSQIENSGRLEGWNDGRLGVITKSWAESVTLFRLRNPKIETGTKHNFAFPPPPVHLKFSVPITPSLHHSTTPIAFFHPSIAPSLRHSTAPTPLAFFRSSFPFQSAIRIPQSEILLTASPLRRRQCPPGSDKGPSSELPFFGGTHISRAASISGKE